MIDHIQKPVLEPEAWAAAQVEAVAVEVEKRARRRKAKDEPPAKVRGVFFRARADGEVIGPENKRGECPRGEWWALFYDGNGRRHREKAGTRAAALALYQRRKTEVRQGRLFPETLRRTQAVSLKALCAEYVASLKVNGKDLGEQSKARLAEVQAILGDVPAASIRPQDIERLKSTLAETAARGRKDIEDSTKERPRRPASVNRFLQALKAAYNVARRNGLVDKNPVVDVRLLRENNKRVREMSPTEEQAVLTALAPVQRRFGADLRPMGCGS
ncbi:MAG TPA: hypothetical protein VF579_04090 [Candidatus Methylomirabilis sp.]